MPVKGYSVEVNPEVVLWARRNAGLNLREAAKKFNIQPSKLEGIESGAEAFVSGSLFRKMVAAYRQPPLAFYLSSPPAAEEYEVKFRTTYESVPPENSFLIETLVRGAWARQRILRAAMESEEENRPVSFIGSLAIEDSVPHAVKMLTERIGGKETLERYYSFAKADDGFKVVRKKVEESRVFVVLKGDLGSYHSKISVRDFRGLAISDKVAPFIIINPNDSPPARTFTLLHELVHLFLGEDTISREIYGDERVERFCNETASHCMLPENALSDLGLSGLPGTEDQLRSISRFARERNLSGTMVAYRLFRAGRIDQLNFATLRERFYSMWQEARTAAASSAKKSEPSYYVVQRSRLGDSLVSMTKQMLEAEAISTTKAAKVLDVRPINVGEILDPSPRTGK